MSNHLINDVIYTILLHISFVDVSHFCRIDKRVLAVCKSERGEKEIKRKEQDYFKILIDEVIKRSKRRLFNIIRNNYVSYLSNDKYIHFVREIYPKTEKNADMLDLFCEEYCIFDVICRSLFKSSLIEKENKNILRGFLYANKNVVLQLRREIETILIKYLEQND